MAASALCGSTNSSENRKIYSLLCNSVRQCYSTMNSVTQDPINEAKTSTVAINSLSEVKPRSGEDTVPACDRIPCDKRIKFCDCCKEMVSELNEVKSELSSCKEIIRI